MGFVVYGLVRVACFEFFNVRLNRGHLSLQWSDLVSSDGHSFWIVIFRCQFEQGGTRCQWFGPEIRSVTVLLVMRGGRG